MARLGTSAPSLPLDGILNADEQSFSEPGVNIDASPDVNQPVQENNCEDENSLMSDNTNESVYNNTSSRRLGRVPQ